VGQRGEAGLWTEGRKLVDVRNWVGVEDGVMNG